MKTVFRKYDELIDAWLSGQDHGSMARSRLGGFGSQVIRRKGEPDHRPIGVRMFFQNRTVYSYGEHFPIAKLVQTYAARVALLTVERHSATTNNVHVPAVRHALDRAGFLIFNVAYIEERHRDNVADYASRVAELIGKGQRALKPGFKEMHFCAAETLREEANHYAETFGLKVRVIVPELTPVRALAGALTGDRMKALGKINPQSLLQEVA